MKSFLLGQNLKANTEQSEKNLFQSYQDCNELSVINQQEKLIRSPYKQNLKKQLYLLGKKSESPDKMQINNKLESLQSQSIKLDNYPERCYINRIVEYKIPNQLRESQANQLLSSKKKLYDRINHDEEECDSLIIRQKSYLRLTPDYIFNKKIQNIIDQQDEQAYKLPSIHQNSRIQNNKGENSIKFQRYDTQNSSNEYSATKKLPQKNSNINERIIQQINLKYAQRYTTLNPSLKENSNNRYSDYTSFSKQNKRSQSKLNQSYSFVSNHQIENNIRQKVSKYSLHNQSYDFQSSKQKNSPTMKNYLNVGLNSLIDNDSTILELIKLRK
ncbi:hypothetical protein TTHERM_00492570 (macronuclear) [Tetrahymena thermophila SB210]|uniref:Uncharacterized protein n=1 Tax=Tetrahymena thermophila (strain SB210) TaxID=312017 RepID=I7MLR0_TETTS|nr:hypothetical protein TTHERM_00492570 [Tetrahymena thermophila SB210]EAS02904.2 hypothetical protein TTHERM_00492570 [Tetrahymena thermophila SB210]|eukprot:XP_001023149.2 hypothetical protein TTHERM_00492570 [Tetrahymena thermophila SB210]